MNQVRLVIERELLIRVYSKAYVIGTLLLSLVGVAACWALSHFGPQISSAASDLPSTGFEGNTEALNQVLHQYGINSADFLKKLQAAIVQVDQAASAAAENSAASTLGVAIGVAVTVVLLISLMVNGVSIAQGVVEEKSSQIVEILLSTLRPMQLMVGKIIGIGISGVLQIFVIIGTTLAAAFGFGLTGYLSVEGLNLTRIVAWSLAWFLMGYFTYASLFAAVGSTAAKPEEVQNVIAPVSILLALAYYASIFITSGSQAMGSQWAMWAEILKYVPLMSPLTMPGALLSGQATDIEGLIALGIAAAALPLIVLLASRIYSRSILQLGARVKLSSVFRRTNS
jgi:ABC-2 type transport system permease protein